MNILIAMGMKSGTMMCHETVLYLFHRGQDQKIIRYELLQILKCVKISITMSECV